LIDGRITPRYSPKVKRKAFQLVAFSKTLPKMFISQELYFSITSNLDNSIYINAQYRASYAPARVLCG